MRVADVAATLRRVSALRSLCLRLPHLPTSTEARLFGRFQAIASTPQRAAVADLDALVVGWRRWWREGRYVRLLEMRSRLPPHVIDCHRGLSGLAQAAIQRRWIELQAGIERCTVCLHLRPSEVSTPLCCGEIPVPPAIIRVLFVGVAPTRPGGNSRGAHFYSNGADLLRTGLFRALDRSPFRTRLVEANSRSQQEADSVFHQAGFFFVHAGKIRPTRRDAPPTVVLETCAREHLLAEIQLLQPRVVCLLGGTRGHLPRVARALFGRQIRDVPERVSVESWDGHATVTTQPRRGGVQRARDTLVAIWRTLAEIRS